MLAPEPQLSACLHILYLATIRARVIGWEKGSLEQIADLMDAVHNIPQLLQRWETVDEKLLLGMLQDYDRKWGGGFGAEYERIVQSAAAPDSAKLG